MQPILPLLLALLAPSPAGSSGPVRAHGAAAAEPQESPTFVATPISDAGAWQAGADLIAFQRVEPFAEVDLNGDGDMFDLVLHVHDVATATTHNLGLAGPSSGFRRTDFLLSGPHVLFFVGEAGQGATDLNGDGDASDDVVHLFDLRDGSVTNLGLAGLPFRESVALEDGRMAFHVSEPGQRQDLNDDGDLLDTVVHVGVADARTVQATPLADSVDPQLALWRGHLLASVHEGDLGAGLDLNGDGDTDDRVLGVREPASGRLLSPRVAMTDLVVPEGEPTAGWLAFLASEAGEGRDLNGDGDTLDEVLHLFEPSTRQTANQGLALARRPLVLRGDDLGLVVREDLGDLNGDGDTLDEVLHLVDLTGPTVRNLRHAVAASTISLGTDFHAFDVWESQQGNRDLNGDGDTSDFVQAVALRGSELVENLGVASGAPAAVGRESLLFLSSEVDGGGGGPFGGGATRRLAVRWDARTGRTIHLGWSVASSVGLQAGDGLFSLQVLEGLGGLGDLNGDGDTTDTVPLLLPDGGTGVLSSGWASLTMGTFAADRSLTFTVAESTQGNQDLNGDGDTDDVVLVRGELQGIP